MFPVSYFTAVWKQDFDTTFVEMILADDFAIKFLA
jgi:hypothetical protein